jgi:hypothetical protein
MSPSSKYYYLQIYSSRFVTHTPPGKKILCSNVFFLLNAVFRILSGLSVDPDPDPDPAVYLNAELDLGFAITLKV